MEIGNEAGALFVVVDGARHRRSANAAAVEELRSVPEEVEKGTLAMYNIYTCTGMNDDQR